MNYKQMPTHSIKWIILFCATLQFCLFSPVHAGVISFTQAFDSLNDDKHSGEYNHQVYIETVPTVLTMPLFDTSLGTLSQFTIAWDTEWWHRSYGSAVDPHWHSCSPPNHQNEFCVRGHAKLVGGANSELYFEALTHLFSTLGPAVRLQSPHSPGCEAHSERAVDPNFSDTDYINCNITTIPLGWSDWSSSHTLNASYYDDMLNGTGLELSLMNKSIVTIGQCGNSPDPDNMCEVNNYTRWRGNVTVSYLYSNDGSESVPEPASLVLMGLGLAGIGWKRRKAA